MMQRIIKSIYLGPRFYWLCSTIAFLFVLGFFASTIYLIAKICLALFFLFFTIDFLLLFFTGREIALLTREIPEKFSNGDDNTVSIYIKNNHYYAISVTIIDEIPFQFQIRNHKIPVKIKPFEEKKIDYTLTPTKRGEYEFGRTNVYVSTSISISIRRLIFNESGIKVPVYPSFLNIRKFEFLAVSNRLTEVGIKRVRKIGQHSEFDQIKEYIKGDDIRTINWKATAKKNKLMANQYQDERSQQIYNLIDMGRVMKMPFNQMSLLDYAINSSLVLSNTALIKHDKAGLITFNTSIDTFLPAERKHNTTSKLLELLYRQDTLFEESNYELLYVTVKRHITHRSLLVLYTNFESLTSLSQQLPYLQRISKNHLLLVILFENTEITEFRKTDAHSLEDIYIQTIADKFIHDKHLIVKELNNHGILSVLARPQDLSVKLVNKYLELKDRNII